MKVADNVSVPKYKSFEIHTMIFSPNIIPGVAKVFELHYSFFISKFRTM